MDTKELIMCLKKHMDEGKGDDLVRVFVQGLHPTLPGVTLKGFQERFGPGRAELWYVPRGSKEEEFTVSELYQRLQDTPRPWPVVLKDEHRAVRARLFWNSSHSLTICGNIRE